MSQGILQQYGNHNQVHAAGASAHQVSVPQSMLPKRAPRPHRSHSSEVNPVAILAYGTPQQQLQMLGANERGPRRIRSDGSLALDRR